MLEASCNVRPGLGAGRVQAARPPTSLLPGSMSPNKSAPRVGPRALQLLEAQHRALSLTQLPCPMVPPRSLSGTEAGEAGVMSQAGRGTLEPHPQDSVVSPG